MPEEPEEQEEQREEESIQVILPMVWTSKWDDIHQIYYQGQNYYRIVDFIDALDISVDPADYWSKMKQRIKTEGFDETRRGITQFEVKSPKDKRLRKHDYATMQIILRLVQSIPSPKVEEGKIWLAQVGEQRLQQEIIDRVTAEVEEAREKYRRQERDPRWIEDRILNLVGRNDLTDQWLKRGAERDKHFASLTLILHAGALGVTPAEHRRIKQLPARENIRDHMDRVELALLTLAEATAATKHIDNDSQGIEELEKDVRETARTSEKIRQLTEQDLGHSVVNPKNFLPPKKQPGKSALPAPSDGEAKQPGLFDELDPPQA